MSDLIRGGAIPQDLTQPYYGNYFQQKQSLMDYPLMSFGGNDSLSYTPSWDGAIPGLNKSMGLTDAIQTTGVDNIADFGAKGLNSGFDVSLNDIMGIGSTLMNAYNVYNQIQMQKDYMNMAKEQLGMAKEQWGMTKDEIARIAKVREGISYGYSHGGNYPQNPPSRELEYTKKG